MKKIIILVCFFCFISFTPLFGYVVSGMVYYSTTPLDGVTVELVQGTATSPPLQSTTTSSGFYSFSSVDPGSYWIKVYGPTDEYIGWRAHSIEVVSNDITKDMYLPKKMTLLSPENNAFITSRYPTLSWEANSEAAKYEIQINVTEDWQLVEFVKNIMFTYYTVQTELTPDNYTWQVGAYDAYNHYVGTTQTAFRFTVLGTTIYVDASNTNGIEDGSQEYPFNTIMEGINAAYDGDTVLVAAGTYYENVVMKAGVDLIGVGANMVTIDAGGIGNVIEGADRCTIEGFTITNSGPDHSCSGIDCPDFCTMLITNNIISSCTNGIYCRQSSSIISNNVISSNGNVDNGIVDFAICCNDSSLTIYNNLIMDNLEVAIYTCWSGSDSAIILNNTIANNVDDDGVWCYESSPTIKNNIIVGNHGGIVAIYSSSPKISYNDVWNNMGADYDEQTGSICEPGIGDISADPMFVDASNGDYHLQYNSPCIDAGTNALELPFYDFDGNLRILDGNNDGTTIVDMGADEYVFSPITTDNGDEDGNGKKGGCFIATAAYDSPVYPHVRILRDFRDKYLMSNKLGRALVNFYYKYSPSVADFIVKHKALKVLVQINLLPLIAFSYSMVYFGPIITAVIFVFIFILSIFLILFVRKKIEPSGSQRS